MTIVETIETVTAWLNNNVCPKILLKLPDDNGINEGYELKKVNPTAFSLFAPTQDKLPPKVQAPIPSVVVQLLEGTDNMTATTQRIKLQLSFTAWNPGKSKSEGAKKFTRDMDGWKDVWSFLERTLGEIENSEYMDGVRLVKEQSITFGQFQQEGQLSDLYPYWGAWAIFTVETSISRSGKEYKTFL